MLPLPTGTAANAIALASVTPPWGIVFCHGNAHIRCDESGAPEFYGNGLRLSSVGGENGKMTPETLGAALDAAAGHGVHSYEPTAFSFTQLTECGTVYEPAEIEALCELAKAHGLVTHLDGARFGNAVATLGCEPADITWKAGVDMMSFGASKNGCLAAEALVLFNHHEHYETAERLRKRGGHLLSKMRYISCQLLAYLEDQLWLDMARKANGHAAFFAAAVKRHPEAALEFPRGGNQVFVRWTPAGFRKLEEAGIQFLMWPGREDLARFVFGHTTSGDDTKRLVAAMESE